MDDNNHQLFWLSGNLSFGIVFTIRNEPFRCNGITLKLHFRHFLRMYAGMCNSLLEMDDT